LSLIDIAEEFSTSAGGGWRLPMAQSSFLTAHGRENGHF
jgi:hypothetical protein